MLNASVGVQRVIGRLRRPRSLGPDTASTLQTRSVSAARQVRGGLRSIAVASHLAPAHDRRRHLNQAAPRGSRGLIARLGHDRIVAVAVATIVLGASVASVSAGGPANGGPIGGPTGDGSAARIPAAAVGGLARDGAIDGDDYQSVSAGDGGSAGVDGRPDRRRLRQRGPRRQHARRPGPVPRGRHAAQADRRRHGHRGRQRPAADLQGAARATRSSASPPSSTSR